MNNLVIFHRKAHLTLSRCVAQLLFLALSQNLLAQNVKTFTDGYGVQGKVSYAGEWSDSLLPASGAYELQWRMMQRDTLRTYRANGRLRNHKPHGLWTWEEADWNYSIETGPDITPVFTTEGVHEVWRGSFAEGVPSGKWVYALGPPTTNPNHTNIPLRIEAEMTEGHFTGKFTIRDRRPGIEAEITGTCNKAGIAEKTWTFSYSIEGKPYTETHLYDRGILIEKRVVVDGEEAFTDYDKRKLLLNATADSSSGVMIGDMDFTTAVGSPEASTLLETYLDEYLRSGWKLDVFPFYFDVQKPVFKRFAFKINSQEEDIRAQIVEKSKILREAIDSRFEGRNIEIKRARSAELDLSIAYLQASIRQLHIIDSLMLYSHEPLFIYYDRNFGAQNAAFELLNKQTVVVGAIYPEEATGQLPLTAYSDGNIEWFETLKITVSRLRPIVEEHLKIIDQRFAEIQKEGTLRVLELEMAEKLDVMDSLYAPLTGLGEQVRTQWVDDYFRRSIQDYSKIDVHEQALRRAAVLLERMDSLIVWVDHWESIENINAQLDEGYKYFAYNPYTGERDIELSIKNRFRRHVQILLTPWAKAQLVNAVEWSEFEDMLQQNIRLQKELLRFAFLEERADVRLDRRIRKEEQPERMMRVFLNYMDGR